MSFGGKKKYLGNETVHPDGSYMQKCQKLLVELRGIRATYIFSFPDTCYMWFRLPSL